MECLHKTYYEVLTNIEVVIQELIETAKSLERSIPEPKEKLAYKFVTQKYIV